MLAICLFGFCLWFGKGKKRKEKNQPLTVYHMELVVCEGCAEPACGVLNMDSIYCASWENTSRAAPAFSSAFVFWNGVVIKILFPWTKGER